MNQVFSTHRHSTALSLLFLAMVLIFLGLIAIASASVEYGQYHFDDPWHQVRRHLFYLFISLILSSVAFMVPTDFWRKASPFLLIIAFALLVLVLMPGIGQEVKGAQRWLPFGLLTFQPSEAAKLALILYSAGYLVRQEEAVRNHWQGLIKLMSVLAVISIMLLSEPDFGAVVIIVVTVLGMMFLAGANLFYVCLTAIFAAFLTGILIFSVPYRLQRLTAYQDPWADPFGAGFQLIQSLIAFGRGEWLGVGLGSSVQKLFYLPEAHTDFVFSIWAEETGFVGGVSLILLFVLLVGRIMHIGWRVASQGSSFEAYICFGVALMFAGQTFINMGASSGLLPTKGLTLPFVSYGGSSLLINCISLAIVLRIAQSDFGPKISGHTNKKLSL